MKKKKHMFCGEGVNVFKCKAEGLINAQDYYSGK